jgi:hypothetical protein
VFLVAVVKGRRIIGCGFALRLDDYLLEMDELDRA